MKGNVRPGDLALLSLLGRSLRRNGLSPSVRELGASMDRSNNAIDLRIKRMKRLGMLTSGPQDSCRTLTPLLPPSIGNLTLVHVPIRRGES